MRPLAEAGGRGAPKAFRITAPRGKGCHALLVC
jgi:hypothetical protein